MSNPQSFLASTVGQLVGTGPGRGMALLFIVGGSLACLVAFSGYLFRVIREVDTLIPDQDTLPEVTLPQERIEKMQKLLERRKEWITQPDTPERKEALKDISSSLRRLGSGQLEATE